MAEFDLPIPMEETPEQDDPLSALMALAREQQKRREEALVRLRGVSQQQGAQAQGLRDMALLSSFGQNPLLQGLQREAGTQGAQLQNMVAQAEARADSTGRGGVDPLGIARFQQMAEYQRKQQALAEQKLSQQEDAAAAKAQAAKDKAAAGAAGAAQKRAEKVASAEAKLTGDLRKEFEALQPVKEYRMASISFDKVRNASSDPSPAGDLALIFGYMKTLDPTSAVRETEFANAQNAAGVPERIRNAWNKTLSGERLNPEQRQEFVASARNQLNAYEKAYQEQAIRFSKLAPAGAAEKVIGAQVTRPPVEAPSPARIPATQALPTGPGGSLLLGTSPEIAPSAAVKKQYSKSRNRTRELDASGNVIREYEGPPRG